MPLLTKEREMHGCKNVSRIHTFTRVVVFAAFAYCSSTSINTDQSAVFNSTLFWPSHLLKEKVGVISSLYPVMTVMA